MKDPLFWIYLANAVAIIDHEIDSAYWNEWKLFRLPGGIALFLALHVPLLGVILYGLVDLSAGGPAGLPISLLVAAGGLFALVAHGIFLLKGGSDFRTPASIALIIVTGVLSAAQAVLTVARLLS